MSLFLVCTFHTLIAQQFKVTDTQEAFKGPFSGNVILYLSTKNEQPKDRTGWHCYRMQVRNVKPGETIRFSDSSLSYPTLLTRLERGEDYM